MVGFVTGVSILGKSSFAAGMCSSVRPRALSKIKMSLQVGDKLDMDIPLSVSGKETTVKDLFAGKKVALVSVPGALTGTCLKSHMPGFVKNAEKIKSKGIDEIYCVAVNDYFVMDVFGEKLGASGKVTMLADGGAKFAKSVGLTKDTGDFGGLRSARYSMLVQNGNILALNVDASGLDRSSAEVFLNQLDETEDPLAEFCRANPEADECREYDE